MLEKISWKWVGIALGGILIMRIGGLVSNFWATLGIVSFLVILVLLLTLSELRKFSTGIFILWVALSYGLPILRATLQADWPILSKAVRRRSIDTELKLSELADPIALRARIDIARYCQDVESIQSEWVAQRLEKMKKPLKPPRLGLFKKIRITLGLADQPKPLGFPIPLYDEEKEIPIWLDIIEKRREECRLLILQTKTEEANDTPGFQWPQWLQVPSDLWEALSWIPWIAAIALATLLLVKIFKRFRGGKLTFGQVVVFLLLIALGWFLYQHWDQIKGELPKAQAQTAAASIVPPLGAVRSFTFDAGEIEETLECGHDIWYRIWADKYFTIIQKRGNVRKEIPKPADKEFYWGGSPGGIIKLLGIENNTTVWMQRMQVRWK